MENPCCPGLTPQDNKLCRHALFGVLLSLGLFDMVTDWLLFTDVSLMEEGLVYGPPGKATIYALLTFSTIGSVTFLFEVVNLWLDLYKEKPWVHTDIASALTIWIEDLPQIIINVTIAACREYSLSVYQLIKASGVFISKYC